VAEITIIGNASIASCPEFSTGRTTGYLRFYDERYRPQFPLTSLTVCQHFMAIWDEPYQELWKAGAVLGWCEALMENSPETFMSLTVDEYATLYSQGAR